mgnify:CR=1 FL=1|tara:strand:+ start:468 stop:1127 length:660 start_codon:yes stop_codon:yes gene_type:complete
MKKKLLGLILLLILFTTYTPNFNFNTNSNLNIKKIRIENNYILSSDEIEKKLDFLLSENLFLMNIDEIHRSLKELDFIDSFSVKKIYPNTIKIKVIEKKPIAILQNKKKKYYISDRGDTIIFKKIKPFKDLPIVFGGETKFYSFYKDILSINFPIDNVEKFYFFESGRWDIILRNKKVVKLPINNYLPSLKNFLLSQGNTNFERYKIFDYRIKEQLILN